MSIIIRKETQPVLDSAGLNSVYVDVLDKCLVLCFNDGTEMLKLKGIKVPSTRPTKVEVAYIVEIFNNFLNNKKEHVKKYIELQKELNDNITSIKDDLIYFYKNKYGNSYYYKDSIIEAVFFPSTNILKVEFKYLKGKYNCFPQMADAALLELDKIIDHEKREKVICSSLAELSKKIFE